jgi:hypothetical protein
VGDAAELERLVRRVTLQEEALQLTFVTFVKVLDQCATQWDYQHHSRLLRSMGVQVAWPRTPGATGARDTATLLATRAINGDGGAACKKRRKYSDRYDGYVAQFKSWEGSVLGHETAATGRRHSRRWDILRGCFVGARNARIVAALKIVYVDYVALRVAGDLVFRLVSKVAQ